MAISDIISILGDNPDMWAQINQDEVLRQMQAQQAAIVANQQAVVHSQFPPPRPLDPPLRSLEPDNLTLGTRARELFLKRMGGLRAEMAVDKDDFLQCHVYNGQVYVFYCFGGRHGVTLEPIDMFPSDQLITQFRLVLT